MKRWTLLFKVSALIGLTLLMLIPVTMIMGVIDERHDYQLSVIRQITDSAGGRQVIAGPIVVQPYVKELSEVIDGKVVKRKIERRKYFLPESLTVKGDLNVEKRKLGIYRTQVYKGDIQFEGQLPELKIDELQKNDITLQQPYLIAVVADSRGIINVPRLMLSQQQPESVNASSYTATLSDLDMHGPRLVKPMPENEPVKFDKVESSINFEAGVADSGFSRGVHAFLPKSFVAAGKPIEFKFTISLQGSQSFSIIPVGRTSTLELASNWPHPNFLGSFLPTEKTIDDKGFTARWQSSWFANNMNDSFDRFSFHTSALSIDKLSSFDVNLIEMVDEYQLNERSVKYSILFIGLTFVAFFLFEVLKGLRIHPIQYLLVGTSLALFYLILLALSEHIGFNSAYFIAAFACSGLIGFYLSAVLRSKQWGLVFSGGLLILYVVLFGLLQSENVALLLGSLVLFCVLAAIMALTRHFDWYSLSQTGSGVSEIDEAEHSDIIDEIDRKSCRLWK